MEGRPRLVPAANSSRAGEGAPRRPLPAGLALDPGGAGTAGPRMAPPPAWHWGQEAGLGAGRLQFDSEFHPQRISFATHGFSWLLRGPSAGALVERPERCPRPFGGVSLWPGVSVLPPSSLAPGRAAPPEGLLWSQRLVLVVSSACSSLCVADRSFTEQPGQRWLG